VSVTGGGTTVTSTLVVKTTGPHASLLNSFPYLHPTTSLYATLASLVPFGLGFVLIGPGSFKRRRTALMSLLGLLVGIASCGGSTTPPPPVVPSTPAGTTAFTVSTTSTTNAGSPSPANPNQQLNIS